MAENNVPSAFDPSTFMNTETTEAGDTKFTPIPQGEYEAVITDVDSSVQTSDKGSWPVADITFELTKTVGSKKTIEELRAALGREKLTTKLRVFLDLSETGALLMGPNKNIKLNATRDAVGQNVKGKPWNPRMLIGAGPCLVVVSHRDDKNDDSVKYDQVKSVHPLRRPRPSSGEGQAASTSSAPSARATAA